MSKSMSLKKAKSLNVGDYVIWVPYLPDGQTFENGRLYKITAIHEQPTYIEFVFKHTHTTWIYTNFRIPTRDELIKHLRANPKEDQTKHPDYIEAMGDLSGYYFLTDDDVLQDGDKLWYINYNTDSQEWFNIKNIGSRLKNKVLIYIRPICPTPLSPAKPKRDRRTKATLIAAIEGLCRDISALEDTIVERNGIIDKFSKSLCEESIEKMSLQDKYDQLVRHSNRDKEIYESLYDRYMKLTKRPLVSFMQFWGFWI